MCYYYIVDYKNKRRGYVKSKNLLQSKPSKKLYVKKLSRLSYIAHKRFDKNGVQFSREGTKKLVALSHKEKISQILVPFSR